MRTKGNPMIIENLPMESGGGACVSVRPGGIELGVSIWDSTVLLVLTPDEATSVAGALLKATHQACCRACTPALEDWCHFFHNGKLLCAGIEPEGRHRNTTDVSRVTCLVCKRRLIGGL
jgi:hypothetical protein